MEILWREILPHPSWGADRDAVIWVDPARFDALWQRTDQWVSPGGKTGAQDDRYRRFGEWLKQGKTVDMCMVWLDEDSAGFTNGRHRFAWLRDQAVGALPMQVSPADAEAFAALCGSPLRRSMLPAGKSS